LGWLFCGLVGVFFRVGGVVWGVFGWGGPLICFVLEGFLVRAGGGVGLGAWLGGGLVWGGCFPGPFCAFIVLAQFPDLSGDALGETGKCDPFFVWLSFPAALRHDLYAPPRSLV